MISCMWRFQVMVREAGGPAEHPVNVGAAHLTLAEFKVATRSGPRRPKVRRKKKGEGDDEDEDEEAEADDGAAGTTAAYAWSSVG